jgi:glutamyl-tRNA reductase
MLNGLQLWNFSSGTHPEEELNGTTFILKTCQRSLVLTFNRYPFKGSDLPAHDLHVGGQAYHFLLETICGLKSKLIGENEIVGQFKEAYNIYSQSTLKDTKLLHILEKLFKDAKDIRTQYLIGISQKTYASLTRRHLIQKSKADHVVVIGSGALAEDLINQFKKKALVSLCARNNSRALELAQLHNLTIIPWLERHTLVDRPFIANTVGTDSILFDEKFFKEWQLRNEQRKFVDLGSPSVIKTDLAMLEGVVRLVDIFDEGAVMEGQKLQQIELARVAMLEITKKRKSLFEAKFNSMNAVIAPQSKPDMRYL